MAKKRYINTKFWSDNYISDLDPIEKLLFIYFITNPYTDICGIYEISLKQVALDTGIDKQEMLPKIIKRFSKDGKIFYLDGWIYVKNFQKHQAMNESVELGIKRSMNDVPSDILAKVKQIDTDWVQTGTVSTQSATNLDLTKPNLTKPNHSEPKDSQDIVRFIELWEDINPAYRKFFANKTERGASADLIKISPLKDWEIFMPLLKMMNADQYAKGKATKPTELLRNIGFFKAWIDQKKSNSNKVVKI